MATPKVLKSLTGSFKGTSKLHTNWGEDVNKVQESESEMAFWSDPLGGSMAVPYDWVYEGKKQYGGFLFCGDGETVTAAWTDTWHQSSSLMNLVGKDADILVLNGSYKVEGHPDWYWRVTFSRPDDHTVLMEMTNISPEGEEEWAVEAKYTRI